MVEKEPNPFQLILVRSCMHTRYIWRPDIFLYKLDDKNYICTKIVFSYADEWIPYKGNEHFNGIDLPYLYSFIEGQLVAVKHNISDEWVPGIYKGRQYNGCQCVADGKYGVWHYCLPSEYVFKK